MAPTRGNVPPFMPLESAATEVELVDEMQGLREEMRTLRDAIDELREFLQHAFANREPAAWQPVHRPIKRMSLDPTADDFSVGYELPAGMLATEGQPNGDSPQEEDGGLSADAVVESQAAADTADPPPPGDSLVPATLDAERIQRSLFGEGEGTTAGVPTVADAAVEQQRQSSPSSETAEPLAVSAEPYNITEHRVFLRRLHADELSAADVQQTFQRVLDSKTDFIDQLQCNYNAKQLKALAARCGCLRASQQNKPENAAAVYRAVLSDFALHESVSYRPLDGETYESAVERLVTALTDGQLHAYVEQRAEQSERRSKAMTNPETLEEFQQFAAACSEMELTDEQLAVFDQLRADRTRQQRAANIKTVVAQIAGEESSGLELSLKEGYHDRQQCKLWIVQLSTRVSPDTFNELKRAAGMLDGWWSSYKREDAGFQFKSEQAAVKFAGLLQGEVDRSDELAQRKQRKQDKASSHLLQLAESMEIQAEGVLAADDVKLKNTIRRAELAAGMRGRAYASQAMAATMRRIAAALDSGDAAYLDGVRSRTHVEELIDVLRRAKSAHIRRILNSGEQDQSGITSNYQRSSELDERKPDATDVRFAEFPMPTVWRRHLEAAINRGSRRKGLKQRSAQMAKLLKQRGDQEYVTFEHDHEVKAFGEFLARCEMNGIDIKWMRESLSAHLRIKRANIYSLPELRCALRELLPLLATKPADDPIRKAEEALIGQKIPGFYPTPKSLILRMLDEASLADGMSVLEPSAGKGDILDCLRERYPDVDVTAVEINATLIDVIEAKGHRNVIRGDFLEHTGQYDRILLNPPFEKGQEMVHVRHAFEQLAVGGRLVAIMSAGPFFRQDAQSMAFRDWFEEEHGRHEPLPEGTFQGVEAFRQTGVQTELVVIDRT